MAITSVGYDGPVDEVGFAQMMPAVGAAEYGVIGAGDWKVTAHPSTAQAVNVAAGKGWGHGVFDTSDTIVTVQCAAISSGTRWDLITAKRDWQPVNGTTSFSSVLGGATKEIPTRLTSPGVKDEQPIALVQWTAGQTQPTAIVDLRVWAGNGGAYAKDDLVRSYLSMIGTEVNINGAVWTCRLGTNDVVTWTPAVDAVTPVTSAGYGLSGTLERRRGALGSQVSAAFTATYAGVGNFTIGTTFAKAFQLSNPGYIPSSSVFGYVLVTAADNSPMADGSFNINTAGEVYLRKFSGTYDIKPTDKFYISANWSA